MWISYEKRDINFSDINEISREKDNQLLLTKRITGELVVLEFESNAARDSAYEKIMKDIIRASIRLN
jgi:hypothetical protein